MKTWLILWLISTGILKGKFLASFLDSESIWILSMASFLIEINAKYLQKASNKNCSSPNLGYIIDGCSFYMMLCVYLTVLIYLFAFEALIWHSWSSNMKIEPNISHDFEIDPITILNMEATILLPAFCEYFAFISIMYMVWGFDMNGYVHKAIHLFSIRHSVLFSNDGKVWKLGCCSIQFQAECKALGWVLSFYACDLGSYSNS